MHRMHLRKQKLMTNLFLSLRSPKTLTSLYEDPYNAVFADPNGPLVSLQRSEVAFPSLDVLATSMREAINSMSRYGREGRVLLVDLRRAIGRNDPTFEEKMKQMRPYLYPGFSRAAVLVKSTAGALQTRRMIVADGFERLVTTDEDEVFDYLLTPKQGPPSRAPMSSRGSGGRDSKR